MKNRQPPGKRKKISDDMKRRVLKRYGYTCFCGAPIRPDGTGRDALTFDHIVPVAKGGPTRVENLRPAHEGCNSRKGSA